MFQVRFIVDLPIITCGGDTNVRISRNRTKIATMTPVLLIRSISVIFTALAERTRNITDILKKYELDFHFIRTFLRTGRTLVKLLK